MKIRLAGRAVFAAVEQLAIYTVATKTYISNCHVPLFYNHFK